MKVSKLDIRISPNYVISAMSFLLITLIAVITNFPMFKSWFGIIDDHMVIEQLRPLDHLSFFNLPQKLISDTELGDFGNYPRFRPFYYLLKFFLISILGEWAGGYYVFRTLVQALCCFLLFRVFSPVSPINASSKFSQLPVTSVGLLISVCVLGLSSWTDITLRLGPSELELTFGVLLTCYALVHLLRLNTSGQFTLGHRHYFLICLGVFIAVGAKENGLVTVVPLIILTVLQYKSVVKGSIVNITSLIIVAFQTLLVLSNTVIVIARGADVYGTPRSLNIVLNSLWISATNSKFAVLIIATGLLILLSRRSSYLSLGRLSLALFLDFLFLSESVFYAGSPNALRYQILTQVCLVVVPSLALFGLMEYFADRSRISLSKSLIACLLIYSGIFSYLSPIESLKFANQVAKSNLQSTSIWRSEFEELVIKLHDYNASNVTIHVFSPESDYERIYSTVQFVRQTGFDSSIYLKIWSDGTDNNLLRDLRTFSEEGFAKWEIHPLSSLPFEKTSFCIMFAIKTEGFDENTKNYFDQNCIDSFSIDS
jgi:hypothetical protein